MFDNTTIKLNIDPLIISALKEDITSEDISANSVIREAVLGEAELICKEDGVICGLQIFERVFKLLDEKTDIEYYVNDGDFIQEGCLIGKIKGDIRTLLSGERTALNYLQRMSGVATYTSSMVRIFEGSDIKLVDTRKTTPNNRIFEKYAVKTGGGGNHRMNLSDGIMLKDNHIGAAGSVKRAVEMAREYSGFIKKIEVEAENLDMVAEAVEAGADIIMLDNMDYETMKAAVEFIAGRAEIEVSGNINEKNAEVLKTLGVDYVSSGALTHSAPIMDISLKNLKPVKNL